MGLVRHGGGLWSPRFCFVLSKWVFFYAANKHFVIPIWNVVCRRWHLYFACSKKQASKVMTFTIFTAKSKTPPSGLWRDTGDRHEMATAQHGGRVSKSESSDYEMSSSSDKSLLTDGQLSLKPYMDEPLATPSTLQKVDQSERTLWLFTIDSLNSEWLGRWTAPTLVCDVPLCRHVVFDGFINLCMTNCLADNISI